MPSFKRDSRFWIQAGMLGMVCFLLVLLVSFLTSNLNKQNVHFGLGFLFRPAGFSVLQSLIPFDEHSTFGRAFIVGLLNTLLVSAIGIVLATLIGFSAGLARFAPNRLMRALALGYVELFRNLPLLLILFFFYFGLLRQLPPPRQSYVFAGAYLNNRGLFLPGLDLSGWGFPFSAAIILALAVGFTLKGGSRLITLAGTTLAALIAILSLGKVTWPEIRGLSLSGGIRLIPEFIALATALSIYTAAYIAEIVRAGIESVPKGQQEAAEALGLSGWQTAWLVVIPQALRLIIPPLTSQYLNLTKNSSLAVAIAYPDLVSVFAGTTLAQTGQAVEIMAITMGVYLLLSLGTAAILNWRNAQVWQ